ncbi:MAG: hypothetical protein ACYC8S_01050 [Minisyncoccota bacterium]
MAFIVLIATFSLSLAGMVFLLVRKMYLTSNRANHSAIISEPALSNISVSAAVYYRRGQHVVVRYTLLGYRRILRTLARILRFVARFFILLNTQVQRQLASVTDLIKGRSRGNLASHHPSLYLKDIARRKEEVRGSADRE